MPVLIPYFGGKGEEDAFNLWFEMNYLVCEYKAGHCFFVFLDHTLVVKFRGLLPNHKKLFKFNLFDQ